MPLRALIKSASTIRFMRRSIKGQRSFVRTCWMTARKCVTTPNVSRKWCSVAASRQWRSLQSEMQKPLNVLVMAAGLGTRMKSKRAKVLHELGGSPLIAHVVRAAQPLDPRSIIVIVGHQAEEVERAAVAEAGELVSFVMQANQRGTGDAVESARSMLEDSDSLVLVLSGDVPMIRTETLRKLIEHHNDAHAACSILSV